MPEPVHALILTHSVSELEGALSLFDRSWVTAERHPKGWKYWRCPYNPDEGPALVVAVINGAVEGRVSATEKLDDVVSWLRAELILSCGAGTLRDDTPSGTVLIAEFAGTSYDYDSLKGPHSLLDGHSDRVNIALSESINEYRRRYSVEHDNSPSYDRTARTATMGDLGFISAPHAFSPCSMFAPHDGRETLVEWMLAHRCLVFYSMTDGQSPGANARDAADFALLFLAEYFARPSVAAPAPRETVHLSEAERTHLASATVDRVVIREFKNIAALSLHLTPSETFGGRWTCIAGINGAGKSAVLQALVLGMLGPRFAAEFGGAAIQRLRRSVNDTREDASVEVTLQVGDATHTLTLPITERGASLADSLSRTTQEQLWDARAARHLLLAYGPGRNLSEHIDSRHDGKSAEVRRVITLFDPLAQVASAEAILRERADGAAVIATARALLREVFADTFFTLDDDESALRFRAGDATLAAVDLPDGFRSTIAWLVDLCASWHALSPEAAARGDHREITALVVIDEIDLHLHPSLQRVLVPRLRAALPKVQWVVSTHSPLVLGCFDQHEIVMLERAPDGRVTRREVDRQIAGFSTNEIYEWLMDTPPRGAALDAHRREDGTFSETAARILAQSPAHDEAAVARAYAFRQARAGRARVDGGVREPSEPVPGGEEPEG